ncbi:MAG: ATP-dependent protease ATPase subunit HslU [Chloroflexota bacterium]|nr:ATP-dependent protease ATPase subunit HslU [Chloroflexota bacterium]
MQDLTPRQIVEQLDKYIVGQGEAKRAMAIALRNRYRRQQLPDEIRDEVIPKNLLLIGPTGVGKTEIARRVSKLADAPFMKVEATKFTEVGYVGRDVDSIVRDLVEMSVNMIHTERLSHVRDKAESAAMERLVTYLVQQDPKGRELVATLEGEQAQAAAGQRVSVERRLRRQRKKVAQMLSDRTLEDQTVEIEVEVEIDGYGSMMDLMAEAGTDEMGASFDDLLNQQGPRKRSRKVRVADARRILMQEEAQKMIDFDSVIDDAVFRTEQNGVVFLDEIDKIISNGYESSGDVSGEGVQRDLLPIVEGSTVMTRYGPVKTDHILFIAAGSFHDTKPGDLIPELQGRFPLRVELDSLGVDDLRSILAEPDNALTKQYQALLATEGVELEFTPDGIEEMAEFAFDMNEKLEDIGARRLQTILEQVLEEVSFDATELEDRKVVVDRAYVRSKIEDLIEDEDLSKFIL